MYLRATREKALQQGEKRSGGGLELFELAPQLLDLVAQLRRVLEAQLVGGQQHLLLELHDGARQLVRGHRLLALAAALPAAGRGPRHLRVERQEVAYVRDPLLDRRRRDPVALV